MMLKLLKQIKAQIELHRDYSCALCKDWDDQLSVIFRLIVLLIIA